MKNIFENAYFGKLYKTRDGNKAIYIYKETIYPFRHALSLGGRVSAMYKENGLYDMEKEVDNYHADIVSEWSEDPIICCKCQWDNYYDYRIVFSQGEGHVRVSFFADEIIISDLYISEKFRNKGYATALLDKVDEILNGKSAKIAPLQEWQKEWYLKRGYLIYQEESGDESKFEICG